ncbi:MAG: GDP-mannose 4,6-dehydratase [Proteobacteria bacterium]|nr:GDP-mannose 4,6-dehydratase [Pseudomonadota bacterium]
MKVLVTGGCGFIASHVVDAYIADGYEVVVADNLSSGKRENKNEKAHLYVTDICDEALEKIFINEKPDIVNHHAAQISVPLSVENPLFDAETNIKGTIRLLELSKKYNIRKFIFSSTGGAIYGDADIVPTNESYVPEPASPYAISKFAAEKYIKFYNRQYGLKFMILRYGNVYGPRQIPHGEAGVISIFIEMLLAGEHPVLYHYPEEERGMVRDYCYVKDVANASLIAAKDERVGLYNIGTGKGTHTLELYRQIMDAIINKGKAVPQAFYEPRRGVTRPGDIRMNILDVTKAKEELNWQARYDIKAGVSETVDWYLGQ